jgi:GNAT superfamily N-acetyltransferase
VTKKKPAAPSRRAKGAAPRRASTPTKASGDASLRVEPLTPARWNDLEQLFGPRGACGGCWCMYWRIPRAQFDAQKGEGNRRALRECVDGGAVPGLIGYAGREPVAWCAVEPRDRYPGLARSRILQPVDDRPVWSVSCLYVRSDERRKRRTVEMLRAAADYAKSQGATIVEGYPHEPGAERMAAAFAWTGFASAFRDAGFEEVARRSPKRPIMRRIVGGPSRRAGESARPIKRG